MRSAWLGRRRTRRTAKRSAGNGVGALLAILVLVVATDAQGASRVVFGSFENAWYAEREAQTVASELGIATEVIAFDAGTYRGHRVASAALPEERARRLQARAAGQGWNGAWLLHGVPLPEPPAAKELAREEASQRPAPAQPEPASPPAPEVEVGRTRVVATDILPADAADGVSARDAPRFTPRVASDAGDSIAIPRHADADVGIVIDGMLDEAVWAGTPLGRTALGR